MTLNVWEAVYFATTPTELIALAERAAAIGIERFVLDDGWFGARRTDRAGLGDWVVSTDVWPDGLHPLVDQVREGHAVRTVVRARDDQPRLRPGPAASGMDHGRARRAGPSSRAHQQVLNLAVAGRRTST